jgi:hypothetical protein
MSIPCQTELVLTVVDHLQSASNRLSAMEAFQTTNNRFNDVVSGQEKQYTDIGQALQNVIKQAIALRGRVLQEDNEGHDSEEFADFKP